MEDIERKAKEYRWSRLANRILVTARLRFENLEAIDNGIRIGTDTIQGGEMRMASVLDLLTKLDEDLDIILKWEQLDKEERTFADRLRHPFSSTRQRVSKALKGLVRDKVSESGSGLPQLPPWIAPAGAIAQSGRVIPASPPVAIIAPARGMPVWGSGDHLAGESPRLTSEESLDIAPSSSPALTPTTRLEFPTISDNEPTRPMGARVNTFPDDLYLCSAKET
jgi:hypothetical protein